MIRAAAEQGTRTIVCTPHLYELDLALVQQAREVHRDVTAAVAQAGIDVRLLLGFEVDLTVAATCDLETLRTLCIGGSGSLPPDIVTDRDRHPGLDPVTEPTAAADPRAVPTGRMGRAVVVEMPFSGWPLYLEQTLFRLTAAGFLPILAHPERNERVQRSPDALAACINAGAIAQGTAGSLSAMFRKQSQKTFLELLARGWFSLLASDAHSQPEYTWSLGPLLSELGKRLSPTDRELLTEVNPARVLEGRHPLPLAEKKSADVGRRRFP
jgi:tyrosine-protein phosphatase YwqE